MIAGMAHEDTRLSAARNGVTVRTHLRPGDIGRMVYLHGLIYAREYGFDHTFEAYVAFPLAALVQAGSPRERIWIAERGQRMIGCVAIAAQSETVAQLRWFLVVPAERGQGLGRRLLGQAVEFCKQLKYRSIVLWTVDALTAAAALYREAGFRKVEQIPGRRWGVDVIEERYELHLEQP
jgi:N-acetylglutamate synthase-like GNAT family acetyltransferase